MSMNKTVSTLEKATRRNFLLLDNERNLAMQINTRLDSARTYTCTAKTALIQPKYILQNKTPTTHENTADIMNGNL